MPDGCAIVTGGGTGIGAAVARRLAADGYAVAVLGRRPEPLEVVASEIGGLAVQADVGQPGDCDRAVAEAIERFGGASVLVNNAGIGDAEWEDVLRINLSGAFYMARAALPHLVESRGSIVNVSSISGVLAGPGWAAYCTSKAGLIMLTRCLALDYGPQGVRVNAVCPGWVRTPMGDEDMEALGERRGADPDEAYDLTHRDVPLRRPARAEEIAAVVAFLAGPDASFVSGVALPVDGGASVVDVTATAFAEPAP